MTSLVGALRVSLAADTANFEAGMKRAQRATAASAGAMQKSLGGIKTAINAFATALTVGLFAKAIGNALEYAGSLAEVAQQLGVTAKQLQVYRYAAGQVGVSQDQLEVGLKKLNITLGQAKLGAEGPKKAFEALSKLIGQDIVRSSRQGGDALPLVADALAKVGDRSKRAAAEVAIMGKSGSQLDNLLSGGSRALNELAIAADKLGIVLSDDEIKHADETADKLRQVKTVLEAQIAGTVAKNASAILSLAQAFGALSGAIVKFLGSHPQLALALIGGLLGGRIGGLPGALAGSIAASQIDLPFNPEPDKKLLRHNLKAELAKLNNPKSGVFHTKGQAAKVNDLARKLNSANGVIPAIPLGSDISPFLAGGGKKPKEDHTAEEALRKAHELEQQQLRAQIDTLNAQKDLAADYIERTTISVEILDKEKAANDAELAYQVALNKLTKGKEGMSQATADQLKLEYDKKDSLERQLLLQQEEEQRLADVQQLSQHDFDRRKEYLQSQDAIATTAAERRKIELELLDLAYQQKKQALEYTIATSKDIAAVEDARRDLLNLNKTYANDKQGVMQNTQGPLEQYFSQVPKTAAEANEAMQRLEVQGIDGAINSLMALTDGFQSFRDTALSAIKQVIAELLRMQLMKLAFSLFGGAAGGIGGGTSIAGGSTGFVGLDGIGSMPGFATGGSMILGGMGGRDKNVLSLNGLPIARVSKGEGLHISPNGMAGSGTVVNINVSGNPTRETLNQIAVRTRGAIASANRGGY